MVEANTCKYPVFAFSRCSAGLHFHHNGSSLQKSQNGGSMETSRMHRIQVVLKSYSCGVLPRWRRSLCAHTCYLCVEVFASPLYIFSRLIALSALAMFWRRSSTPPLSVSAQGRSAHWCGSPARLGASWSGSPPDPGQHHTLQWRRMVPPTTCWDILRRDDQPQLCQRVYQRFVLHFSETASATSTLSQSFCRS